MEVTIADQDGFIRSYRDLRVWREAMDLAEACYRTSRAFPKEEVYGIYFADATSGRIGGGKYRRGTRS